MRITTISHTAWLVMMCQLALRGDPRWRAMVSENDTAFYQACFDYSRRKSAVHALVSLIPLKQHMWLVEQALAKGAPQHFALRKQAIRKQTEEGLKLGVTQLVVLGGGFDPLALSMAQEHRELSCFEFDMPVMHAHKMNIVGAYCATTPPNYFAVGEDLSCRSLHELLSHHHAFSKSKPTLFIAEGITMYLSPEAVEKLFRDVRQLCDEFTGFLFTAVESFRHVEAGWGNQLRKLTMVLSGEAFYWNKQCGDVAKFLLEHAFTQQYLVTYADFQRSCRSAEEMPVIEKQNGEYLVYAIANR
jgi:methyltransferase (TIGR00027 family)